MNVKKRRRSVIVGADRGGSGKTFVTAALATVFRELGMIPRIVEYEHVARLADILEGVVPRGQIDHRASGYRAEDYRNDDFDAAKFWDSVFQEDLIEGGVLFDTAANVMSQAVDAWHVSLAAKRLDGGKDLGFAVVATAEQYAAKAAPGTVEAIRQAFPQAKIWLIENLRDGEFVAAPSSYHELRKRSDVQVIQVPALKHKAAARITEHPLSTLSRITDDQLIEVYGFTWGEAARSMERIRRFAVGAAEALLPIVEWMGQEELANAPVPFRFNAG
ncbi:hypothetical protein [Falsiroseomonas sp.]|uniref:hypothetical protein n=1 Tax=Falsiroseomonas sp. TaxID=2870721 RepID=UPI003F7069A5